MSVDLTCGGIRTGARSNTAGSADECVLTCGRLVFPARDGALLTLRLGLTAVIAKLGES